MRRERLERRVAALESTSTPEDEEKRRLDEFLSKCTDDEWTNWLRLLKRMRCPLMISPSGELRPDMKLEQRLKILEARRGPRPRWLAGAAGEISKMVWGYRGTQTEEEKADFARYKQYFDDLEASVPLQVGSNEAGALTEDLWPWRRERARVIQPYWIS